MAARKAPSVREIAAVAVAAGEDFFVGDNGKESRGYAAWVGQELAERYGRSPSRVFARIMMLLGYVIPVPFCKCERCSPR